MNTIRNVVLGFVILVMAFAGCQNERLATPTSSDSSVPPSLSKRRVVQSATGSGHITLGGEWRTFSFTARRYDDGTIDGMAELHSRASDARFHVAIDCLFAVGTFAQMSGTIAASNVPAIPVGSPCIFAVRDNGEGSSSQDLISLLAIDPGGTTPFNCALPSGLGLGRIESGNIQVRP